MIFYLGTSTVIYFSYVCLDYYLADYFPDSTAIVTRKYRVANVVKSVTLMGLCVPGTQFIYNLTFYPELNQEATMNMIGAVYASTDLAALLYNPNCHNSTLVHHIVVQFFYYYCYFMNFNMHESATRGIAIYCVLSSYAFLVNFRLAIRTLPYKEFEYYINEASLFIYITTSMINWIVQTYLLFGGINMLLLERVIYMLLLTVTINDDLFLIKFLRKIDYKINES
jgi:hypothetical protein